MTHATVGTVSRAIAACDARDRAALAVLLGGDARVGARRVDERDDREAVAVGELHHAHRLAVALRIGHPELPPRALLDVASLLLADRARPCGRRACRARSPSRRRRRARGRRAARTSRRAAARRSRACTGDADGGRARPSARSRRRSAPRRCGRAGAGAAASSPESFAPPSSGTLRQPAEPLAQTELVLAGGHQPNNLRRRPSVGRISRRCDDRVEMAEAEVLLGEPEVVGELLAGRLLDDARPGERDERAGLREEHVTEGREAREHPGGGRMSHDDDEAPVAHRADPRRRRSSSAAA